MEHGIKVREPQSSSIPTARFESVQGLFVSHCRNLFSQWCDGLPEISDLKKDLGKFMDSLELQSWKANFKTEVCSKTADPHLTMHWIKEVEIAESKDDLLTSQSITRRNDFPDYDMLDTKTASALRRLLDKHLRFRKRGGVEEQRAQKIRPILTKKADCLDDLRAFSGHQSL